MPCSNMLCSTLREHNLIPRVNGLLSQRLVITRWNYGEWNFSSQKSGITVTSAGHSCYTNSQSKKSIFIPFPQSLTWRQLPLTEETVDSGYKIAVLYMYILRSLFFLSQRHFGVSISQSKNSGLQRKTLVSQSLKFTVHHPYHVCSFCNICFCVCLHWPLGTEWSI